MRSKNIIQHREYEHIPPPSEAVSVEETSEFILGKVGIVAVSMSFLSRSGSTQFVRACVAKQAIGQLVPSNARAASG